MKNKEVIQADMEIAPLQRSTGLKIDPIKKLPLMECSTEEEKNNNLPEHKSTPIVRPTRIVHILHSQNTLENKSAIRLCFLCDGRNVCTMCMCVDRSESKKSEKKRESSFVNAQKPADSEEIKSEAVVDGLCSKKEEALFSLCKKCSSLKEWPLVYIRESVCVIKFTTVSLALLFYQAHKSVLSLVWGYETLSEPRFSAPKRNNILLKVLEHAFSLKTASLKNTEFQCVAEESMKKEMATKPALVSLLDTEKSRDFISMASGRHSNVSLQMKLRELSQEDLLLTISSLPSQTFFYLAKHKYGTYVIQLIISMIKEDELVQEVKKHLSPYSTSLLQHEIGNYVVQRIIVFDTEFVFNCFVKDFKKILSNKIGSRAFKSCIKYFHPYKKRIIQMFSAEFIDSVPVEEQKVLKIALKEFLFVCEHSN